ncbi:hypothetical protein LGN19_05890 [Burkholderia sp. AU30198]|uniref:hypothetical protein n=1 Tax=Burkholderia sp. AU30198 TaxID=2879627 RepID=UPI001CF1E9BD|nr:hypothetical protein [Burkholderia sp. AU30198]MCA8293323.1 hypothetical protein [Burkholderia sp. AU30198]
MSKPRRATIVFYDEDTEQVTLCTVFRKDVQAALDRELKSGVAITIPPHAEPNDGCEITDEDARRLGGIALLMQAGVHPELRDRLKFADADGVDWSPVRHPG